MLFFFCSFTLLVCTTKINQIEMWVRTADTAKRKYRCCFVCRKFTTVSWLTKWEQYTRITNDDGNEDSNVNWLGESTQCVPLQWHEIVFVWGWHLIAVRMRRKHIIWYYYIRRQGNQSPTLVGKIVNKTKMYTQ